MYTIYHNPRCSKSRQALELLEKNNINPEIVLYLENKLTKPELKKLAKLLDKKPLEFTRKKEADFKLAGLTKESSDEEIFDAMIKYPKLIERPIVVKDNKQARLGRPVEDILEIV